MNAVLIWFLIGFFLTIMEFFVPGVILVFFGISAWIVALTTAIGITGSSTSQLVLFAVASVCLITLLRRWVRDKFIGHVSDVQNLDVNLDDFIGRKAVVTEDIQPGDAGGAVEFKGARWSAISDKTIQQGETVRIVSRDGLTLKVE
jgi:inner membrane protein